MLVDSISGALYSPADNALGTVANTLSPAIVYEIGQHFKAEGTEGSAQHILAQTLVAAVTAHLAGNDELTAGLSAGGAEIIAPKLAEWLYGVDDASKLTSEQKNTISAVISLGSAAIGSTTGQTTDAVSSSVAGTVAVVNNRMLATEEKRFINSQIDDYALANNISEERAKRILEIAGASLVDGVEIITSLYTVGTTDITTAEILNAQVYLLQSSEGLTYYNYLDDTTRDLFEVACGLSALLYYNPSDPNVSPIKIIATEVAVTLVAGKILEIGGQVVKKIGKDLYEAGGKYYAKINGKFYDITDSVKNYNVNTMRPGHIGGSGKFTKVDYLNKANELGYSQRISPNKAPFDSHGQVVYYNGKNYITPDVDGHNITNGWKMFNRNGQRIGTYTSDLIKVKD